MNNSPRSEYFLSLAFLLLAVLFWGFSFISTKIVLAEAPPASIAFWRQIVSAAILTPVIITGFLRGRFNLSGITGRDILFLAASGLAGIVLYFIFENNGLKYTTAASAAMIVAAVPVFTFFTEALFFKQRITLRPSVCLAVSVAGVYLVVADGGRPDFSSTRFLGNMLVVGAMVCWVVYTVINKQLTGRYPSLLLTYSQTLFSIPLFLPFVLPETGRWHLPSPGSLLHLLYLGGCCSALGYFFYVYALGVLGATLSAAFLNLIPVVTTVGGRFILGEKIGPAQLIGMGLILGALYSLSLPEKDRGSNPKGTDSLSPTETVE